MWDGMGLVERLRYEQEGAEFSNRYADLVGEAADAIERLERELAAEKALADRLYEAHTWGHWADSRAAYRKARGL